jgi:hypothetical protein
MPAMTDDRLTAPMQIPIRALMLMEVRDSIKRQLASTRPDLSAERAAMLSYYLAIQAAVRKALN